MQGPYVHHTWPVLFSVPDTSELFFRFTPCLKAVKAFCVGPVPISVRVALVVAASRAANARLSRATLELAQLLMIYTDPEA